MSTTRAASDTTRAEGALRQRLVGSAAISAALCAGKPVRLLLCRDGDTSAEERRVIEDARRAGVRIRAISDTQLVRLSGAGESGKPLLLGMLGPDPAASLEQMLARGGAAWLLTGTAYPGNAGAAMRTAELSGADGIVIDAAFDHAQRRDARRAGMRADRFLPVLYAQAGPTLAAARRLGRRIVAIEDSGDRAPWDVDLCAPALFVIGGERSGVPGACLAEADVVVRLPMHGFMPSYNLQAAMAAVASERLRQLEVAQAAAR